MSDRVQAIIDNFNNHLKKENLKQLSVHDWKKIFSRELSFLFSTKQYNLNPQFLYRARPNFDNGLPVDFFHNINQLGAPPKGKIKQGRNNLKGQRLLYTSSHPITTLFETKPETGADLTILKYRCLEEIGALAVMGVKDVMAAGEDFKGIFGNHFLTSSEETKILDDILSLIFKSRKDNSLDYPIYNLTNAIMGIFLHNQKFPPEPNIDRPKRSIGLTYPSVETVKILGVNIAMQSRAAKTFLKPYKAYKYNIIKKHDEHHYEILLTHRTSKIYPNGEIKWEYNHNRKIELLTDL